MKNPSRFATALLLAAMAAAPATAQIARTSRPGPSSVLSAEDLARSPRTNLLDFVSAHRPMWMSTRGPAGVGDGITVYLDNTRLGSLSELSALPTTIATEVRHYRGSEAVLRFGPGHADGVIVVSTERVTAAAPAVG